MQMRRGAPQGALQRAANARMRQSLARQRAAEWVGHHSDDEVEINGASGVTGGYVGMFGGIVAALIGVLTGDRELYFLSLLAIIVVGFAFGVLSGGANTRTIKATMGTACIYGGLFSFVAIVVGIIVSIMVMVPVMMVLIALDIGRYGS